MKKTIAAAALAAIVTTGAVCLVVFTQAAPAGESQVLSEPFGFHCEGPDLETTTNGCAGKLHEKCPGGVYIHMISHTKPEETPAVIEGIAACKVEPI